MGVGDHRRDLVGGEEVDRLDSIPRNVVGVVHDAKIVADPAGGAGFVCAGCALSIDNEEFQRRISE